MTRQQQTILIFCLLALIGFVTADLVTLNLRQDFLPSTVPPPKRGVRPSAEPRPISDYAVILDRNIFNADGRIAEPIGGNTDSTDYERVARETQLPITLVATIVHGAPQLSLAAMRVEGSGVDTPKVFRVGDEVRGVAVIKKIVRGRVYFQNQQNNRVEYVQWKENAPILLSGEFREGDAGEGIRREGNRFSVARTEVQKNLENLPGLLQQARAVPNLGPDGRVDGFKVMNLQPGSIFEKLGIKQMDVITSVNGERVDSPTKAIELFNKLRDAPSISLGITRDGRTENLNYSLN